MSESIKENLTKIGITPLILPHEKFHLKTRTVEDRKKIPNPYYPKIKKLKLITMITKESLKAGLKFFTKEERKVIFSRPCIYGVFGGPLGGLAPRREYCTGCMRCVLEYPNICTVDRNPEFLKFGDSYWIPKAPSTAYSSPMYVVNYEAKTGKIPIKGMGYKGAFAGDGWDSMWTDMSEIVRPTRDGVHGREYISTTIDLGRKAEFSAKIEQDIAKNSFRIVKIPVPIIFDTMSPLIKEVTVLQSILLASMQIPTLFIETIDAFSKLKTSCDRRLWVPLLKSKNDFEKLINLRYTPLMIEINPEIETLLPEIREQFNKSIVFYRITKSNNFDDIVENFREKIIDGVHIVSNYHGIFSKSGKKQFIKNVIYDLHSLLVNNSIREEITIIAGGGITMAEHVPKAIIMGADAISIDTSVAVALQLEFVGEVINRDHDQLKEEKIDISWGKKRLLNLISSWHSQLIEILSAMGMKDVRRLRGDIGRAMFHYELEQEAFGDLEWR